MEAAKDEIAAWVKLYTADMFAYTMSRISNTTVAEDIVQNVFLAALESYAKFEKKASPKTWLFSILKHKIADHYRQRYKQLENFQTSDASENLFDEHNRLIEPCSSIVWNTDDELLDNEEFLLALHQCIHELPKKMSTVVELKYLNGADSHLVCEQLQITQTNFWQIMHRAKLLLKSCLEKKWFKPGN